MVKVMMYSCKDIHEKVLSEEALGPLNLLRFKIHMFVCKSCKVAVVQMSNLQHSISAAFLRRASVEEQSAEKLKEELKKELKQRLKAKFPSSS
jgi:hypothetical protein